MKTCQTCGNQNADDMRFCLNCGKPLPDAPIVFNLQDSGSQSQSGPGTNPYGKSAETQFGGNRGFNQNQFSMAPPPPRKGSSKKIFIAIASVIALFGLIFVGVADIIGYNLMKKDVVYNPTPTPTSAPTASPSVSPSASPSPSATKSPASTPKTTETPQSSISARVKFEKTWVDYNVTEEGEMGMKLHVKFEVWDMKDIDSFVIVYFQKADGSQLTDGEGEYRSKDGRVAVLKPLKPGFDDTVYKDLEIFIPYDALKLTKGKYNLKMDIDLADTDENLIKHMTYHEFKYEKF